MSKIRTFDNGKLSVKFTTEENAKSFDEFYNSEFKIIYNGETSSFKIKDSFDPYEFFNVNVEGE